MNAGWLVSGSFWALTVLCICLAVLVNVWLLFGALIGFAYSVRIAYIMGETAGISWREKL